MSFPSLYESFSLIPPLSLFFCLGEDFQYMSLFSKKKTELANEIDSNRHQNLSYFTLSLAEGPNQNLKTFGVDQLN